jgi:peroxiredoxin
MKSFLLLILSAVFFTVSAQVKVGDNAKDFKLKNVDGTYYSLKNDKEAKGAIVIFTCNHCPFSQAYEQRIIDLDKKYKKLGYPVVAINPNDPVKVPEDSYDEMVKRAKEYKYTFPYLHDETQQTAKAYGAMRTPHVFILTKQKDNSYKVEYIGAIDDDTENEKKEKVKYVENALDDILKGKEVKVKETKAIGCSIKWKA